MMRRSRVCMRLSSTLLRPAALLAVAIAALSSLGAGPRTADALTNCSVADLTFDSEEQAFLTLINNYRAQNGAGALQPLGRVTHRSARAFVGLLSWFPCSSTTFHRGLPSPPMLTRVA